MGIRINDLTVILSVVLHIIAVYMILDKTCQYSNIMSSACILWNGCD